VTELNDFKWILILILCLQSSWYKYNILVFKFYTAFETIAASSQTSYLFNIIYQLPEPFKINMLYHIILLLYACIVGNNVSQIWNII